MSALGTTGPGTAALPEGGRVDFPRMREERRSRLLAAMAAHDLDAVILGRPANVVYASGARQLWTANARPFGPGCVLLAGSGRAHILSTWDEGVPAEIAHEELFGLSWNPARVVGNVAAVPGLSGARRVGTDGLGVGTARLLAAVAPSAQLVDAGPALAEARRSKTADEVACIGTAAALAEGALAAMAGALVPGITERQLLGVHATALAGRGNPCPATEAVACSTPRRGPVHLRRVVTDRPVGPGELVALCGATVYCGYEATVGRTRRCGPGDPAPDQLRLIERAAEAAAALAAACWDGATGADLVGAWRATGERSPEGPLAWGVGLGVEAPVVRAGGPAAPALGEGAVLCTGMVLAVEAWVAEEGVGGALHQDLVHVTPAGPEVLTRA